MPNLFEFLSSINTSKENLMVDVQSEKDYTPFIINRGMSLFYDTCLYANEMNRYPDLPKQMQYDFYLYSIPKKKRFSKWPTKDKESDELKTVAEYFSCSYEKAKVYLGILNQTQIEEIQSILYQGGKA